ncbi:CLUMA_CG003443, isoform A [Clunio marinus]|uniref:CLUMA_CG003443, isoform A n=1 Tax=Clunio marinus TaxID=568069 RepID=A0A1J1HQJ5_9DIPT|nr:CLUMA_CG003443, isoform A [Clunio marinus]
MYTPTHIQVTDIKDNGMSKNRSLLYQKDGLIQRAKGLLTKGKNGTNNCFTTIALGKEKYQTSLKDNAPSNVDWHEECELAIPTQGNRAELVLTCLHHNNFGIDEFLGQITLPLNQMDQFERPRSRWYKLQSKPGHDKKDKDRGELEVRTAFTVKAGSLSDLSKKEKEKTGGVGGSLLSLGTLEKRKSLKKFAKSLGSKMHVTGRKKKDKSDDSDSYSGSFSSLGTPSMGIKNSRNMGNIGNADPGVISEDEDEFVFDNLSHKSSGSSLNLRSKTNNLILTGKDDVAPSKTATLPPMKPPRSLNDTPTKDTKVDEWEAKLYGKTLDLGHGHSTDSLKRRSWENSRVPLNSEENAKEKEELETTIEEQSLERISLSSSPTAPATPKVSKRQSETFIEAKPRPLPRANTAAEPIVSLDMVDDNKPNMSPISLKTDKPEKTDNIFAKKWNKFKKELTPSKQDEHIRNQYNKTSTGNGGERIIIGGENMFNNQTYAEKKVEVSKEILAKYDGKSKEEIMKIAHSLENDLLQQKQKNKELEEYLDVLLLRVMETHPRILQNPYQQRNHLKQSG